MLYHRLLCCLAYENDFYTEARKQMPRVNSVVETPQGPGKVRQVHVLANSIKVLVEGPNDSRQWVDMPVPEPVFDLSMRPGSDARALFSEPTDRDNLPQERRNAGEASPASAESASAQEDTARRSRSRRKKR